MLVKKNILGVDITSSSEANILEYLFAEIQNKHKKIKIFTPNPEIIVYANKHKSFQSLLNSADISLSDGIGVVLAGYILGKALTNRFTGTDFVKIFCEKSVKNNVSIGFLGGRGMVAELAAERLLRLYPKLNVVFVSQEWSKEGFNLENKVQFKSLLEIAQIENQKLPQNTKSGSTHIDMLFVAYGFPKQEEWIAKNISTLPVTAAIGVGGAFDYISGKVQRAPYIIRFFGFEWLWRLIRQPWRFKRQLALVEFIILVCKEKFKKSSQ